MNIFFSVFEAEILKRKSEDEMIGYVYDIRVKDVFRVNFCLCLFWSMQFIAFFAFSSTIYQYVKNFFKPLIYRTNTAKWALKDSKPSREMGGAVLVGHSC